MKQITKEFIFGEPLPVPENHASTILVHEDGTKLAAWFGGTKEGRPDVAKPRSNLTRRRNAQGKRGERRVDFQPLKQLLDDMVAQGHTPNADCSVYQDHKEVFRYYTGMKDVESHTPLNGDELYLIFSMTKMLTCTCALQLWEQGAFDLDDELSAYMSEFSRMQVAHGRLNPDADRAVETGHAPIVSTTVDGVPVGWARQPITIRQLFSMSAGFDYDLRSDAILQAIADGKSTTGEIVRALSDTVLGFEPGDRFRYSLCHDILGALVEVWSGQSLGEYMREHLLEPLGMKETFFGAPKVGKRLTRLASVYRKCGEGQYRKIPPVCEYNLTDKFESGGAGLVSSTADYALFLDALACGGVGKSGKRILSAETIELMRTNQLEGRALQDFDLSRPGYGYGLGVRTHLSPERSGSPSPVGEFGWGGAAGAFSLVDPENRLSLTYFQHLRGWDLNLDKLFREALYRSL